MFVGKSSAWFVGAIADIAQLAEQPPCKRQVQGSSPCIGFARMAEGFIAADLKSAVRKHRGFKSYSVRIAGWCNGNMLDSFSGAPGSSPGPATKDADSNNSNRFVTCNS